MLFCVFAAFVDCTGKFISKCYVIAEIFCVKILIYWGIRKRKVRSFAMWQKTFSCIFYIHRRKRDLHWRDVHVLSTDWKQIASGNQGKLDPFKSLAFDNPPSPWLKVGTRLEQPITFSFISANYKNRLHTKESSKETKKFTMHQNFLAQNFKFVVVREVLVQETHLTCVFCYSRRADRWQWPFWAAESVCMWI